MNQELEFVRNFLTIKKGLFVLIVYFFIFFLVGVNFQEELLFFLYSKDSLNYIHIINNYDIDYRLNNIDFFLFPYRIIHENFQYYFLLNSIILLSSLSAIFKSIKCSGSNIRNVYFIFLVLMTPLFYYLTVNISKELFVFFGIAHIYYYLVRNYQTRLVILLFLLILFKVQFIFFAFLIFLFKKNIKYFYKFIFIAIAINLSFYYFDFKVHDPFLFRLDDNINFKNYYTTFTFLSEIILIGPLIFFIFNLFFHYMALLYKLINPSSIIELIFSLYLIPSIAYIFYQFFRNCLNRADKNFLYILLIYFGCIFILQPRYYLGLIPFFIYLFLKRKSL